MSDTTDIRIPAQALLSTKTAVPEEVKKLEELATVDNRALAQVQTIFPFQLFPTVVSVDRTKITINQQLFFFSRQIQGIMIKDLMSVVVETDLFFGTLQIVDRLFPQDTIVVRYLPKNPAIRMRRIIEGLIVAHQEKIDITKVSHEELVMKLEEIGRTKGG